MRPVPRTATLLVVLTIAGETIIDCHSVLPAFIGNFAREDIDIAISAVGNILRFGTFIASLFALLAAFALHQQFSILPLALFAS